MDAGKYLEPRSRETRVLERPRPWARRCHQRDGLYITAGALLEGVRTPSAATGGLQSLQSDAASRVLKRDRTPLSAPDLFQRPHHPSGSPASQASPEHTAPGDLGKPEGPVCPRGMTPTIAATRHAGLFSHPRPGAGHVGGDAILPTRASWSHLRTNAASSRRAAPAFRTERNVGAPTVPSSFHRVPG